MRKLKEYQHVLGWFLIFGGIGLILQHLLAYGGFDCFELLGHEWCGVLMIIFGMWLCRKGKTKFVIDYR
ncbi:MAG: hypothetical protein DRN25_03245 [Thermoplasmata archaeon]|nr:MAG: hypothetical protein DRN25_03245 [Thermoplasmata archaeon]